MTMQTLRALHHGVYNLNYHLVLVTKYRRKCMTGPMLDRLEVLCRSTAAKGECEVMEFNGEADHAHRLLALTPKGLPSAFVNHLKTVTRRLIRKELGEPLKRYYWSKPVFWSRSDCIITVGGAPLSVLKPYIEQQERPE
ncbi:MAG: IS200/IS605 family transposase [Acidiferrobacter sp.]